MVTVQDAHCSYCGIQKAIHLSDIVTETWCPSSYARASDTSSPITAHPFLKF